MDAVSEQSRIRACKCFILSPVLLRETAGRIPGKFLYMKLIDDLLRPFFRRTVVFPVFRIRHLQIHRHAPPAVDAAGICIRIRGAHRLPLKHQRIIIIDPVQIFIRRPAPYSFVFFLHVNTGVCITSASFLIQIQGDTVCRRTPQLERSPAVRTVHPQIVFLIYIMFPEFRAGIILFPL